MALFFAQIGGPAQHPTATIAVRMNKERRRNCARGMVIGLASRSESVLVSR